MPGDQPNRIHRIDASKENVIWINALTVDNAHEKIVGRSKKDIDEALKYFTPKNI
jgi:hypothetical protein